MADSIRRLELAAWDMEQAALAARALMELAPRADFHALEVGMVVCYARPFTRSRTVGRLGDEWLPEGAEELQLHRALLHLRDTWAAHTDDDAGRHAVDVGALMGDAAPPHAVERRGRIRRDVLPRILALCESQRDRFRDERRRLEAEGRSA